MYNTVVKILLVFQLIVIYTAVARLETYKTWIPLEGTSQATVVDKDNRRAVKFDCNFSGTSIPRAVWDKAVKMDMTECRGIRFQFKCENAESISSFNIYFHSGDGWYSAEFDIASKDWHEIEIDKAETTIEGKTSGWANIDRIRICAWRGADKNATFFVSDMNFLPVETAIYIVRNESAMSAAPSEFQGVISVCRNLSRCLRSSGGDYSVISDGDFSSRLIKQARLIILPYNPALSEEFSKLLADYLRNGGRVICFYLFPASLEKICGIMRGKYVRSAYDGQFASIRRCKIDSGLPENVSQRSWNIYQAKAIAGTSEVLAYWYDNSGKNTGEPAIVASSNAIVMTHILLLDDSLSEKRKLLFGMLSRFIPEVYEKHLKLLLNEKNWKCEYQSWDEATNQIVRLSSNNGIVVEKLKEASVARTTAHSLWSVGNISEAVTIAEKGLHQMLTAYCLAQKSEAGERRGFWCHNAMGISGLSWDEAIRILATNGFTDVFVNMAWGGVTYYKSNVLPVAPEVTAGRDFLEECLVACKKYGIRFHLWKVCWNMGTCTAEEYIKTMKQQDRIQVGSDGTPNIRWLCPSHPANQQMEIDSLVEVAKKYKVDGVHLDYIRYPGENYCFCENCRKKFEQFVGSSVSDIEKTIASSNHMRTKWLEFRRSNISSVVANASKRIRAINPSIKISAAVFSDLPRARDGVAQDWETWCKLGYLDFVCPMNYTHSVARFEIVLSQQLQWTHGGGCYPGIGLSLWQSVFPWENMYKLIDMISVTHTLKTRGFTIFDYNTVTAKEIVPLCGMGITRVK